MAAREARPRRSEEQLAEAIRYALNRWTGLTLFLEDGKIGIDSNVSRTLDPAARPQPEDALFAGSDKGASMGRHRLARRNLNSMPSSQPPISPTSSAASSTAIRKDRIDELLPWAYPTTTAIRAMA